MKLNFIDNVLILTPESDTEVFHVFNGIFIEYKNMLHTPKELSEFKKLHLHFKVIEPTGEPITSPPPPPALPKEEVKKKKRWWKK